MKIVVLDGYTLNPGDLDWSALNHLGDCDIYDRTLPEQILPRAKDADCLLTNKTILNQEEIASLPNLKYIGVLATGTNVVDIEAANKSGITVTNTPNYTGLSGAQAVLALILELTNRVGHHSDGVMRGKWSDSLDFCYWEYPLVELDQLSLGIVGYGGIGKKVAAIATALGMNIIVSTRTVPKTVPANTTFTTQDELFKNSDIITLHCPLTPATTGVINTKTLQIMKNSAFLINIARGGLIIEEDLAEALNTGEIAGAALDVLAAEPPNRSCPLLNAKNCYITPHIAWATRSSRQRLLTIAVNNLNAFMNGHPENIVTPSK